MLDKIWSRSYFREMMGAVLVYAAILVAALTFGRPMPDSALRTAVLLSPMAGFGLMIWAVARHVRRIDEFMRQYMLESVAIAAAITAGLTFTYGFLENAGFPRLSMFTVWPILAASWGATNLVRGRLAR